MKTTTNNSRQTDCPLFGRTNIILFLIAFILIVTGYLLMSGSGSTEHVFNADIFSPIRIVIAPAVCLFGYLLIIIGILKKPH